MKHHLGCLLLLVASAGAMASGDSYGTFTDPVGDAAFRRTDSGNNGILPPGVEPIDLASVSVSAWTTPTPITNPYSGTPVENGDLLRVKIEFVGVVAPPGPAGIGLAGGNYDPFRFGPRPVYGFIDFDIDDQKNSGGELWSVALNRYLANVARFGMTPPGSISERVAVWGPDLNTSYYSDPQYERTGAELTFVMCGCWTPQLVSQDGDMDGLFDAGETWIVRGRFFERALSFATLSGLFGGSDFGLFDPEVNVRWRHDPGSDRTVVELVFPLTMYGAALLTGQPEQPIDNSLFNHTSVAEAAADLADSAGFATGVLADLWEEWEDQAVEDALHPQEWRATALIGTAYVTQEPDARYVWTDVGFDETLGDVDGDELAGSLDRAAASGFIAQYDGGPSDCDGTTNGRVTLCDFARNFCLFDFNSDGVVNSCDVTTLGRGADLNNDGLLDFFDVSAFLQLFSQNNPEADFTGDGLFDFFDVSMYLQAFSAGCP